MVIVTCNLRLTKTCPQLVLICLVSCWDYMIMSTVLKRIQIIVDTETELVTGYKLHTDDEELAAWESTEKTQQICSQLSYLC